MSNEEKLEPRDEMMLIIRSVIFNIVFYANLIARLIYLLPTMYLGPRDTLMRAGKNWAKSSIWLQQKIAGTYIEIEGLENLPEGNFILAPQHQSIWDTFFYITLLKDPVFILKQELLDIPLFGTALTKSEMIAIDRSAQTLSMLNMLRQARKAVNKDNRQLIIFPEGTRRPAGSDMEYKQGIANLYRSLKVPIVPVALTSGLFWPHKSLIRQNGRFKTRILPAIETGLSSDELMLRLVNETEIASDELLIDAVKSNPHMKLSDLVKTRIAKINGNRTQA